MNLIVLVIGAIWGAGYLESIHNIGHIHTAWITSFIFYGDDWFAISRCFFGFFEKKHVGWCLVVIVLIMIVILSNALNFYVLSFLFSSL